MALRYLAHGIGSTGLNWHPSTKKSKKLGCVSSRQCCTFFTSSSSSCRFVFESNAMVAPSIAVLPACTIFAESRLGTSPIRFDASTFDMPPKPSRQIKNVDIVEVDSVARKDDVQSSDIGALGLGQLVHVAFQQIDFLVFAAPRP